MDAPDELTTLRAQAVMLAGATGDLAQRAGVYHHLYAHSGGNHGFPLLAAHGALWASGYFRRGMRFGGVIARVRGLAGGDRDALIQRLHCFAEDFRDINRRVCVETFFIYWLTARPHLREEAERLVPAELLDAMDRCHDARRRGVTLDERERRALFEAFFLWEQAQIVGPSIEQAFARFDWPLIRGLALRPRIGFAYFTGRPLAFRDFASTDERVAMGMRAFDRAVAVGWDEVEAALCAYRVMPPLFRTDPRRFFDTLAGRLLPGTAAFA